jgi:hypothetical protein
VHFCNTQSKQRESVQSKSKYSLSLVVVNLYLWRHTYQQNSVALIANVALIAKKCLPGLLAVCVVFFAVVLCSCYSFTGNSIPPHLTTLSIATAEDESTFGDALLRERLTQQLITRFRNDNSLRLVQENATANLSATIVSVVEETVALSPAGATLQTAESELDRKMTVTVRVRYEDRVKKVQVWEKNFTQFRNYPVAQGFSARVSAVDVAVTRIAEDVLLAVVSGW